MCHPDSGCKHEGYVCSKKPLTDPKAIEAYTTAIAKTTIYQNPTDYLLVSMQVLNVMWPCLLFLLLLPILRVAYVYFEITYLLTTVIYLMANGMYSVYYSPQCRDTFYIESFHVVVLIYAPKRIHFGDETYEMRIRLAILDWVCGIHLSSGHLPFSLGRTDFHNVKFPFIS